MFNRRNFIASSVAMMAVPAWAATASAPSKRTFPKGFHWGAATAGHQIEGNNVNSDFWVLEHTKPTLFSEPSGDACNSLILWAADLDLAKSMGLNCYRFSIEWSRIEPAPGQFSIAMLDHYKRVVAGCRQRGLTPMVTFNHWTVPVWFAAQGSWTHPDAPDLFARYCDRVMRYFGDLIGVAFTLNEPNGLLIARAMVPPQAIAAQKAMLVAASRAHGVDNFIGGPAFGEIHNMLPNMLKAHKLGKSAIKAARSDLPVGATLAVADDQAAGPGSKRDEMRKIFYGAWIDNVKGDDFVGVQNYVRNVWDAKGKLPDPAGVPLSSEGQGIYPSSLAGAVRYVHEATGLPVMVTEHGYYITDDKIRISQLPLALAELKRVMDDGVPVLGYIHWTLIDNFEWVSGFAPKLGLASVDPKTFVRTPKPSAAVFAAIARRNSL
ncbi:glycoside hydrolase family 1 protein [Massilia niastensis]|uniref:glycoside hydrolase family 1 protein n=1 Tax=Massilia niastensis TaxID=544911 RepID=UPI0003812658|nr:family 1 glycosylhydrolase [Massilia niastensis]